MNEKQVEDLDKAGKDLLNERIDGKITRAKLIRIAVEEFIQRKNKVKEVLANAN